MKTYKTVIDLEKDLKRDGDVFSHSQYPSSIWGAKGVLVKENHCFIPKYQTRPQNELYIFHASGVISDEQLREAENACRMDKPVEEMHGLHNLVYGLTRPNSWGRNAYLSSLILSGDLYTDEPHAQEVNHDGWDYLFCPGDFRLGLSGRVFVDEQGNQFQEELYLRVPVDMAYSFVTNGGMHLDRVGIIAGDGAIDVVYEEGKRIDAAFPEQREYTGFDKWSNFKRISLESHIPKGMHLVEHSFTTQTRDFEPTYMFLPRSQLSSEELVTSYARQTDHLLWKLFALDLLAEDPNTSFFKCPEEHFPGRYSMNAEKFNASLGSTGRTVRIANNYGDGYEWPSNWQPEYMRIELSNDMVVRSLMALGEEIEQIAMYERDWNDPWEVVHAPRLCIGVENRIIYYRYEDEERIIH